MPVYFARTAGNMVKIGWAGDVSKRIATLKTGCPTEISVARVVDGERNLERAYHRMFRHQRIRGEWFIWSKSMLTAVADAASPPKALPTRGASVLQSEISGAIEIAGGAKALSDLCGLPRTVLQHWQQHGCPEYRQGEALEAISLAKQSPSKRKAAK